MSGIEDDRALVGFDRFVELPRLLKNDAEVAMPVRRIWRERQALPNELNAFIPAAALVREHASEVQGSRIRRIDLENFLVDDVGLVAPAVVMKPDGDLNGLSHRQFARRLLGLWLGRVFEQLLHVLTKHRLVLVGSPSFPSVEPVVEVSVRGVQPHPFERHPLHRPLEELVADLRQQRVGEDRVDHAAAAFELRCSG